VQDVRASTWIRYRPLTNSTPNTRHQRKHLPLGIETLFKVGLFVGSLVLPMTSLPGQPLTGTSRISSPAKICSRLHVNSAQRPTPAYIYRRRGGFVPGGPTFFEGKISRPQKPRPVEFCITLVGQRNCRKGRAISLVLSSSLARCRLTRARHLAYRSALATITVRGR